MSECVSILMPMRNAEEYIKEAIESVLNQTHTELEVIVIDDCSTDASREIVESILDKRIKLLQGEGQGISAALNLGLKAASGDYVCRCDADDLYPVERLNSQLSQLKKNPKLVAVAGKFTSIDEKGRTVAEFNTGNDSCDITGELNNGRTRTHLGTFLIKMDVIKLLGGFRPYFVTAEDIDLQLRLAEVGPVEYLAENMYFYRIHNSSITHVQSSVKRIFYEAQARAFSQQRQGGEQDLLQLGRPPTPPSGDSKATDSSSQIQGYLIAESWRLHTAKNKKAAIEVAFRLCRRAPFKLSVWKNLIMILLKK